MVSSKFGGQSRFQLFSLFNRFCDPHSLPLKIPSKQLGYLMRKLNIKLDEYNTMTLEELVAVLEGKTLNLETTQKLYDETVLDIILQGEVKAKIHPQG